MPILYSEAREQLQLVRRLEKPSLIAVVSVSQFFLDMSRGVLSPFVGPRHSMREYLVTGSSPPEVGAADITFCDCIAHDYLRSVAKARVVVPYRLIAQQCFEQIRSIMADS